MIRNLDWVTVIIYLLMIVFGAISIYAASYDFDEASMFSAAEFSGKQFRWIGLSFILAFVILLIDARMYETYAYPIYIAVMILLLITPFVAHDIKGSRSWISFGSMSLQPAEFAKFATALALAKLFNAYQFVLNAKGSNYLKAIALIILPIILILAQNETGSALTFMALFFVLYREGMSGLILFAAVFAVIIFVVAVKYVETSVFGMPTGEFVVFSMIMAIMIGMSVMYSRRIEIGRNLLILFAGTALVEWALTVLGHRRPRPRRHPRRHLRRLRLHRHRVYTPATQQDAHRCRHGCPLGHISILGQLCLRPSAAPPADAHQGRPRP